MTSALHTETPQPLPQPPPPPLPASPSLSTLTISHSHCTHTHKQEQQQQQQKQKHRHLPNNIFQSGFGAGHNHLHGQEAQSRQPSLTTGISWAGLLSRSFHYPFAAPDGCQLRKTTATKKSDDDDDDDNDNDDGKNINPSGPPHSTLTSSTNTSTDTHTATSTNTNTNYSSNPITPSEANSKSAKMVHGGGTATARSTTASSSPNSSHLSLPGSLSSALSWTLQRWNSAASTTSGESTSSSFWGGGSSRSGGGQHPNDHHLNSSRSYPVSRPPSVNSSRHRPAPYRPPPLPPISLTGYASNNSAHLLTPQLAEEIRQLIPPRLQLHDTWTLVYSLEQHGVSLATLYEKCAQRQFQKGGFVLVIKDDAGGIFGAFVNERFKASGGRYYGTGECFLWKSSWVEIAPRNGNGNGNVNGGANHNHHHLGIHIPKKHHHNRHLDSDEEEDERERGYDTQTSTSTSPTSMGSSTAHLPPPEPEPTMSFKAFPYSGVNDYMILCEQRFLSVGGGDGKYGLWVDDVFEKGASSTCATFGNEPLSEEGEKFVIIGVEVWSVGGAMV